MNYYQSNLATVKQMMIYTLDNDFINQILTNDDLITFTDAFYIAYRNAELEIGRTPIVKSEYNQIIGTLIQFTNAVRTASFELQARKVAESKKSHGSGFFWKKNDF